ncbi:MAG: DUF6295 family protein [Dehalococcoidia bacterium]
MCTNIVERAPLSGSGKGREGWFKLTEVSVSYDHPFDVALEHAVNIDFTNESAGAGARVAVELTIDSAKELLKVLMATLDRAEEYERAGAR